MSPRVGRPKIDNPKDVTIRCRVSKELNQELEKYCEKNKTTKSEVMTKGIEKIIKAK